MNQWEIIALDNCLEKRLCTATRFGLIVTVALLAARNVAAQQAPSAASPHLQPNAGGEAAVVKRVVDGIMQPYLSQEQHPTRGRTWSRSPNLGAIVAVSQHGHRYFFPYGKATNAGTPFAADTLVEIDSCTKTFTTTLFALAINRNQILPDASAQKYMPEGYTLQAQQLTPLELADFTSGMPDDPTNLPRLLERRSIDYYTVNDFLTWASRYEPTTQLPAPYRYSNAGIGLLSYLIATATGKTWEVGSHFRRQCTGTALCATVENEAWSREISTLYLFILDKQAWYLRLGWTVLGPCVWHERPGEIMCKHLPIV
jgi:hypothetical protein